VDHLDTLKKLRIVIRAAQRHSAWIEKQCGVSGAQLWIMQELDETPGLRVGKLLQSWQFTRLQRAIFLILWKSVAML